MPTSTTSISCEQSSPSFINKPCLYASIVYVISDLTAIFMIFPVLAWRPLGQSMDMIC